MSRSVSEPSPEAFPDGDQGTGLLKVDSLSAGYGGNSAIRDVSLQIEAGSIVALLGHNGAGKSTLCRAIYGMHRPQSGRVLLDGVEMPSGSPRARVKAGISFVPQDDNIFPSLSVTENLLTSLGAANIKTDQSERISMIMDLFPILHDKRNAAAGSLSGGQRQMVAVSLALVRRPRLLILDEPTLGIAPNLVERLMQSLEDIRTRLNVSILLVDQNVRAALSIANEVHILRMGEIVKSAPASELVAEENLWKYF